MTSDRPSRRFVSADHITQVLAFLALSTTLVIGVRYGTLAVGSPESTCAVGQARMFVDGQRSLPSPLPDQRFPAALSGMLAPPGFVALTDGSDRAVPGCPAGLSFAMSAAMRVGGDPAVFLLVPLFGVLAVWSTYLLGRTLAGPWAGVAACSLMVCSPLFMYGVIQPISDVPAAALWVASLAAAIRAGDGSGAFRFKRAIGTGLLAGLAIMVRPHLFPLAAVPIMLVSSGWQQSPGSRQGQEVSRHRLIAAAIMGMLPGVAAVAWLQWRVYGSAFGSATTAADGVVGLAQAAANMAWYIWWLGSLHTPVLALALLAPFVVGSNGEDERDNHSVGHTHSPSQGHTVESATITPGEVRFANAARSTRGAHVLVPPGRRREWLLLAFALAVWALELPYGSVIEWQQTRALLPALPMVIVLAVAAAWSLAGRRRSARHRVALLAIVALVGGWWVHNASERGIFRAKAIERKYREAGRYAATTMAPDAVILAVLPAGSIRYYAEMPTLTWSAIPAGQLDALLDDLRSRGYAPLIALDVSERGEFSQHFAGRTLLADLDWPARMTIGRDISVYDPADRARHLAGDKISTGSISWPVK